MIHQNSSEIYDEKKYIQTKNINKEVFTYFFIIHCLYLMSLLYQQYKNKGKINCGMRRELVKMIKWLKSF